MVVLFNTLGLPHHAQVVAEIVHEYDPELSLERLPPGHPNLIGQPGKPYAIIHRSPAYPEYIFSTYSEGEIAPNMVERVLGDIFHGDAKQHGRQLSKFDADAFARRLIEQRNIADKTASDADRMAFEQRKKHENGKRLIS